jgi:hypothetical protein
MAKIFNNFHFQIWWPCLFIFITCVSFTAWAVGPRGQSVIHARARSPATKMMNFRLGLNVVLPKSSAGAINFIWTTYLGNYHNCSTLVGTSFTEMFAAKPFQSCSRSKHNRTMKNFASILWEFVKSFDVDGTCV